MTTSKKISSFLDSFLSLNRFSFSYKQKGGFIYNKFLLHFEMPVHCALMYSLLSEMLIEDVDVYLENSNEIRILVFRYA